MEMKLVNILEHKHLVMWIFFCMHTYIENDVHRVYTSFSLHRHFFYFRGNMFFVIWVSHVCESSSWGDQSRYLDFIFYFCPSPPFLSLIPQLLTSRLAPSASLFWIWCHFNIGLILVVQIKMLWTVDVALESFCTRRIKSLANMEQTLRKRLISAKSRNKIKRTRLSLADSSFIGS